MKQSAKLEEAQPTTAKPLGSTRSLSDSPEGRDYPQEMNTDRVHNEDIEAGSVTGAYNPSTHYHHMPFLYPLLVILTLTIVAITVTLRIQSNNKIKDPMVLTSAEKKSAISLIEESQQLNIKRMEEDVELNNKQNEINLRRQKLFLEIQRHHGLDPNSKFVLNEYQGTISKQQ